VPPRKAGPCKLRSRRCGAIVRGDQAANFGSDGDVQSANRRLGTQSTLLRLTEAENRMHERKVEQGATTAPPVVSTRADNLCLVAHIPTISRDSDLKSRAGLQCVKLDARCVSSTPTLFSLRDRLPSALGFGDCSCVARSSAARFAKSV
jgi:hypothetical protein